MAVTDPYKVLGIPHSATDAEIRAAYRRQVQLHHPDHNGGSPESTRRFEEVQEAYALIRKLQQGTGARGATSARRASPPPPPPPPTGPADPGLDARLAELDRELKRQREVKKQAQRNAQRIREDALRQAREAARADSGGVSDEDLGYVTTDDSFSAILDDAASEWGKRFSEAKQPSVATPSAEAKPDSQPEPVTERLADLFDGWGARLRGEKQRDKD
jgi:curved DNA-binding protein CbpA